MPKVQVATLGIAGLAAALTCTSPTRSEVPAGTAGRSNEKTPPEHLASQVAAGQKLAETGQRSSRIAEALGTESVAAAENGGPVDVGALRLVSADEADRRTFAKDRIVGYPIVGAIVTLSPEQRAHLGKVLVQDDSYAFDARMRCANRRLLGARFSVARLEFALGLPCNQAFWAFRRDGKVEHWGAVMTPAAAEKIIALIDSALPPAPSSTRR